MSLLRLIIVSISWFFCTSAIGAVDDDAMGIWASKGAKFYGNGLIHTGLVVYLRKDGLGVIAAGFPPIGSTVRVAQVLDDGPMSCVMTDSQRLRSCVSQLRMRNKKLEISGLKSEQWQTLEKISNVVSDALREDFAWDQYDGDAPRKPENPALQSVLRLASLPDFKDAANRLKSTSALTVFQTVYWRYTNNKAFAVSSDGVYGYSASGLTDRNAAIASALKYCRAARKRASGNAPCHIVNVNGQWD